MEEKKRIIKPINTTSEGMAYTIVAKYGSADAAMLMSGGGHYPRTGVIEYEEHRDNQPGR